MSLVAQAVRLASDSNPTSRFNHRMAPSKPTSLPTDMFSDLILGDHLVTLAPFLSGRKSVSTDETTAMRLPHQGAQKVAVSSLP
jgi:hypothetical protein